MQSMGLGEHAPSFRYHNVTGSLLLELNKNDIIEDLKVDKFGHRQKLLEEIATVCVCVCARARVCEVSVCVWVRVCVFSKVHYLVTFHSKRVC
jgi:hypothetical protein